jgi:hypothetical protein
MNADRPDFAGMTLNERLYFARLVDKWDAAFRARDREAMLALLAQVDIAEPGRAPIVDTLLADPRKYGF